MYKIFIRQSPLFLLQTGAPAPEEIADVPEKLVSLYSGKQKSLFNYIDKLEKMEQPFPIVVFSDDVEQLWADFKGLYKIVAAGGGVVTNARQETLLIFRRGFWDLPKGKIDKGETPAQAAVREVQEETGLIRIALLKEIVTTFHTYTLDGKRILKPTYWFSMQTEDTHLTPQTSEDIEKAEWVNLTEFMQARPLMYGSIHDVLDAYGKI